jgi:predicted transcriptional regulator
MISPWNDLAFKMSFANESHPDILAGLIRDFFGFEPKSIKIVNPYDIKAYIEKRRNGEEYSVLRETLRDVTAQLATEDFTAEVQVKRNIYFGKRSVYYGCNGYCGNYNKPPETGIEVATADAYTKYASLRPIYTLNILDEKYFEDAHPLRIFRLHDPMRGLTFEPSYLNFGYFEPSKAECTNELTENQGYWRDHFLGESISPKAPNYIREAAELLEYVNMTKEERDMIDWADKVKEDLKSDILSAVHFAREEVREEVREEEAAKAKAERLKSAQKLKTRGFNNADIADILGMSEEEIINA